MRYGAAVVAVALALALKILIDPLILQDTPFLLVFAAIMLAAWYGGLGPGLVATALAALITDYFFLHPQYSFSGPSLEAVPLLVFLLEGALVSTLTTALHSAKGRAEASTREALERQEALRFSEERFRLLVDGVEDYAIFMLDPQGRVASWNSGAERLMEYAAEEVTGEHFSMFFTPESVTNGEPEREIEVATEEGRFEDEALRTRKDGSMFEANVILTSLRNESGEPRGFAKVVRDVTERNRTEEALASSLTSLLALYEAGRSFASTLKGEEICSELLTVAQRLPGVYMAAIELGDGRKIRAWQRVFAAPEGVWPLRDEPEVEAARRLALQAGTMQYAELSTNSSEEVHFQALVLPLGTRGRVLGVLEAYGSEALSQKENKDTLTSLAGQAASSLENARLYEELAERERQLHDLISRLLVAQEEERRRVAYEVHDGPTQLAVAAYQRLQELGEDYPLDSPRGREDLAESVELVKQMVGELRGLIADLRPTVLDDLGLSAAVRQQAGRLRREGCQVSYEDTLGDERLLAALETTLFRIAQEAINNVSKHARADRARVALRRTGEAIRLEVQDWGGGFRQDEALEGGGPGERVGLSSMHERAVLLGGELRIESEVGSGTLIVAEIPLSKGGDSGNG